MNDHLFQASLLIDFQCLSAAHFLFTWGDELPTNDDFHVHVKHLLICRLNAWMFTLAMISPYVAICKKGEKETLQNYAVATWFQKSHSCYM